jgi:hypothetical protein
MPKLEVFRPEIYGQLLLKKDKHLLALVSDTPLDLDLPRFLTDDVGGLAGFLIDHFKLNTTAPVLHQEAERL